MRIGLLGDIHGNLVALDAVLADSERRDVESVVCLGDIAAGGPEPGQTIARLRELRCAAVRGNADEWLLEGIPPETEDDRRLQEIVAWSRAQVGERNARWLGDLPLTSALDLGFGTILCFHGSPRSNVERILPRTPEEELEPMLAGASAEVLAGGHTHVQMIRRHRSSLLVNPGSVGLPLADTACARGSRPGSVAEYAIVDGAATPRVELLSVPVDAGQLARAASDSGMPHAHEWTALLSRRIERRNAQAARKR